MWHDYALKFTQGILSQIKLALSPKRTRLTSSKATVNLCLNQLLTLKKISVKTAVDACNRSTSADLSLLHFEPNFTALLWDSENRDRLSWSQAPSSSPLHDQTRRQQQKVDSQAAAREKQEATSTSERMSRLNNSKNISLKNKTTNRSSWSFSKTLWWRSKTEESLEGMLCCGGSLCLDGSDYPTLAPSNNPAHPLGRTDCCKEGKNGVKFHKHCQELFLF